MGQPQGASSAPRESTPSEQLFGLDIGARLLHYAPSLAAVAPAYIVSNEIDFFRAPIDARPADTLLCFGTNSAYDFAARRRPEHLVLADCNREALMAHEMLYKPLILIAKTPGEFLAMLAVVRLTEEQFSQPIAEVFEAIVRDRGSIFGQVKSGGPSRLWVDEIATRIERHPKLGAIYANFVRSHLEWIANGAEKTRPPEGAFPKAVYEGYPRADSFGQMCARYHPLGGSFGSGASADPQAYRHARFSFVSNPANFSHIQDLFERDAVEYALADANNYEMYRSVGASLTERGRRVSAISVLNIPDTARLQREDPDALVAQIFDSFSGELPLTHDFCMYRTVGRKVPHDYQTISASNQREALQFQASLGIDVLNLELRPSVEVLVNHLFSGEAVEVTVSEEETGLLVMFDRCYALSTSGSHQIQEASNLVEALLNAQIHIGEVEEGEEFKVRALQFRTPTEELMTRALMFGVLSQVVTDDLDSGGLVKSYIASEMLDIGKLGSIVAGCVTAIRQKSPELAKKIDSYL